MVKNNVAVNKCKLCTIEIPKGRKFCSLSCSSSYKGAIQRRLARENYIKNPNKCLFCGENIMPKEGASLPDTRCKKFCSSSCSAKYNNSFRKKIKNCVYCGGIITRNSEKFCSYECRGLHEYKSYIEKWKQGIESGTTKAGYLNAKARRYILKKYNNRCSRCGWSEINPVTGNKPLQIEHIDGNYRNNKEENLDLVCPNCHSLTPTYRSLNAGSGRGSRKNRDI